MSGVRTQRGQTNNPESGKRNGRKRRTAASSAALTVRLSMDTKLSFAAALQACVTVTRASVWLVRAHARGSATCAREHTRGQFPQRRARCVSASAVAHTAAPRAEACVDVASARDARHAHGAGARVAPPCVRGATGVAFRRVCVAEARAACNGRAGCAAAHRVRLPLAVVARAEGVEEVRRGGSARSQRRQCKRKQRALRTHGAHLPASRCSAWPQRRAGAKERAARARVCTPTPALRRQRRMRTGFGGALRSEFGT